MERRQRHARGVRVYRPRPRAARPFLEANGCSAGTPSVRMGENRLDMTPARNARNSSWAPKRTAMPSPRAMPMVLDRMRRACGWWRAWLIMWRSIFSSLNGTQSRAVQRRSCPCRNRRSRSEAAQAAVTAPVGAGMADVAVLDDLDHQAAGRGAQLALGQLLRPVDGADAVGMLMLMVGRGSRSRIWRPAPARSCSRSGASGPRFRPAGRRPVPAACRHRCASAPVSRHREAPWRCGCR